ncbi:MAG TPA: T9SS type A sorting domain-containing protein [Flavobacterium sp.]
MKKLYTIIIALSLVTISYAQPILNATDFTSYCDLYGYTSEEDILGLSPGDAGANTVWDFSAMTATFDGIYSILPVESTLYANDFPTANFVYKISNGDSDFYAYYKVSSTTFEKLGSKNSGAVFTNKLLDTSTILKFPYTYQTVFTDSYRNEGDPIEGYTKTITYDGYGTLKTPYDTYINVIRKKSVEVRGNNIYTDYEWCTTNPGNTVMSMSFYENPAQNQCGNYTTFLTSTNLSVKVNDKEKLISVYPNPTTSILNLNFSNALIIDKVVIIDILGKKILQQESNTTQINVEKLAAGLYIIEAYSGNEKFTSKFVKK